MPPTMNMPIGGGSPAGRNEAVQIMERLCAWFEENEPSSPVPYFLKRAIRAVGADFMKILADIAPNLQDQARLILKPDASEHAPRATTAPTQFAPQVAPRPATSPAQDQPPVEFVNPFG